MTSPKEIQIREDLRGDRPRAFCVIYGTHRPFDIEQADTLSANEEIRRYVDRIVYGQPSRIFGIYTGRGTFVALVEWDREDAAVVAAHTMRRMPSFPHGCSLTFDVDVAFKEFGTWVCHYAGVLEYHKAEMFTVVDELTYHTADDTLRQAAREAFDDPRALASDYVADADGRDARFTRTDDGEADWAERELRAEGQDA